MSLQIALDTFKVDVAQCVQLVSNAHGVDTSGVPVLPPLDQRQITAAAFLNMYVAWETFIEESLAQYLIGTPSINGTSPTRFAAPASTSHARELVIGMNRFFDYGNHEYVRKVVRLFLDGGAPFEPHISAVLSDLGDLRTMRNAAAHITSSTQTALEALAQRILTTPQPGIDLYRLLLSPHPGSSTGNTVFGHSSELLVVTGELIATG
jgi:hypothetical protein